MGGFGWEGTGELAANWLMYSASLKYSWTDSLAVLSRRSIIETVNDQFKNISQVEQGYYRSRYSQGIKVTERVLACPEGTRVLVIFDDLNFDHFHAGDVLAKQAHIFHGAVSREPKNLLFIGI